MNSHQSSYELKRSRQLFFEIVKRHKFKVLTWHASLFMSIIISFFTKASQAISHVLQLGSAFMWLDIARSNDPLTYSDTLSSRDSFSNIDNLLNSLKFIGLLFVRIFFVILWSLLFIFPGMYKAFVYSLSDYVYRDSLNRGENIKFRDALKRSSDLVRKNATSYFKLLLTFIIPSSVSYVFLYLAYVLSLNIINDLTLIIPTLLLLIIASICNLLTLIYIQSQLAFFYALITKSEKEMK